MQQVLIGMSASEGDRLGHLVRGVQMLRSFGDEIELTRYSDVIEAELDPAEPPAFACVLAARTTATLDGLKGICRETEWALGDEPDVLAVWLLQYGQHRFEHQPRAFRAIREGRYERGMILAFDREDFARVCDWGQQLMGHEVEVMGEGLART